METLGHILNGFSVCLQPMNLWYTFLGVFIGTIVGILPGIGPAASIAILIPATFGMDPTSGLIMMAGIYYGTKYGGSTTSILLRTPGEASSVMTSIEGYEMARKGRGGAALAVSAIGSFIAGTIGVVALTIFALPLAAIALKFGPAEYFNLMIFALTAVASLAGKSLAKGMLSTVLGLVIATVGIDLQSGQQRFTGGIPELMDGIGFIVVVVGMFAVSEVLRGMEQLYKGTAPKAMRISGKLWLTREEWKRSIGPIWRGGIIGFLVGILPGAGGTIASMLSYSTEKRLSKHPEEFGKGAIEGVAGPESANNSDTAGAMVPLLTLGVPGGGATAVMMGAFIMHGIQPGPLLFQNRPDLVWGLIDSMYIGNIMLLVLNLPLIGLFVRLLYIPSGMLYPLIVAISVVGTYSVNASMVELYLVLGFGVLGYLFEKVDIPVAPLVLSLVLAGIMEQSFRQAMTISDGSLGIFVGSGITITLAIMALLSVAMPFIMPRLKKLQSSEDQAAA
ncbi:MAG: tripartite tricarboxylate transporter permease [Herminiimonas sp.]|uniref:tripartite tricarboxylate transporter permease n=1 Tax=Herminiimonas sp. TaxID=1926289 RepID=UPI0027230EE8|nr:tripartite tricarboxylate transporter permease [Herminiimonas sp.]MDO9420611.1 tripartite tricarboxylate transporter permease [Herminiimonas sp.]